MGRARAERRIEQFRRTGAVTVKASVLKGTASMAGIVLIAALAAGMYAEALRDGDAGSLRGWGLLAVVPFALLGAVVAAVPMVRRRRLLLTPAGLEVSSWRGGRRVPVLGLRWQEIQRIEAFTNTSGEDSRTDVRIYLVPGSGRSAGMDAPYGCIDLPTGFAMSTKDLAALMAGIRSSFSEPSSHAA